MTRHSAPRRRSLRHGLNLGAGVLGAQLLGATGFCALAARAASAAENKPKQHRFMHFGRGPTRIAMLLPSMVGPYRRASAAVLEGYHAGHKIDGDGIQVRVFEIDDDRTDLQGLYQRLVNWRYTLVVGPITRANVNRLSRIGNLPLATLTLNLPDDGLPDPANSVLFGLPVEREAQEIARQALAESGGTGLGAPPPRALVVADSGSLAQRGAKAFLETWRAAGGESYELLTIDESRYHELSRVLVGVQAQAVFVATGRAAVPVIRAALGPPTRLYATSMLNVGASRASKVSELLAAPALDGLTLVEMPWLVRPMAPLVRLYEHSERLPHLELQRLYALGIDAFRISRELLEGRQRFDIEGVTGRLRLDVAVSGPRVDRTPVLSLYRDGYLEPADGVGAWVEPPVDPAAAKRPGR
ncbi:MAG: penicillin-binding protein activator [Burkholderiaceae bacterium]|nr:penicillin-binding protein activator [Burkholderiaceae bacterium]